MGNIVFGLLIVWIFPVIIYASLACLDLDLKLLQDSFNNPFSGIVSSALRVALMLWVLIGMARVLWNI